MKIQLFGVSVLRVIFRFYLMMSIVILFGIIGNVYLMAIGMAVFITAALAIKFDFTPSSSSKVVKLGKKNKSLNTAV